MKIERDREFIYELGKDGCNRWWSSIQTSGGRAELREREELAALFSAAPDLLAALQEFYMNNGHPAQCECTPCRMAEAAIAKAEGLES